MTFNLRKEVREFEENVKRNASKLVIGDEVVWTNQKNQLQVLNQLASYRYLLCISNNTLVAYQVTKWKFRTQYKTT